MLDLDHFKGLNDTRGHDAGDRLLVEVARRLQRCVRAADTVARIGGDEFVLVAEDLDMSETLAAEQVATITEQIRDALLEPVDLDPSDPGRSIHISTTSVAVTLFNGPSSSVELRLKQADIARYQAKDAGCNAVRYFDSKMQDTVDKRMALEMALRSALVDDEFELHYQPQCDPSGRIIGAEALLRWRRSDGSWILPGDFIPVAEETGLIVEIGNWVLSTAAVQIEKWSKDQETSECTVSVNVSARQFFQPDFCERVVRSLADAGADPRRMKIELTESVVLEDIETASARMRTLIDQGLSF